MTSKARKAGKAASALRATTERQVEALTEWQASDPEGLALAVAEVGRITDARRDDPEVAAHAALVVGGYREGARSPEHAAASAVAHARRTVATAHALTEWAGDLPDMVEAVEGDPDRAGTLTRYAPAPDAPYRWHAGDLVETLTSTSPRLRQVATEYRAHLAALTEARERGEVAPCGCGDHLSHRVTLQGMSAHLAGLTRDDSGYWSTYRATRQALATAREEYKLHGLAGDPDPMAPAVARTSRATGGDRTPTTSDHPEVCDLVNGRPMTAVERQQARGTVKRYGPTCAGDSCGHDSCHRIRYASLSRASRRPDHGGEWGSVTTAPAPSGDRTHTGQVRAFPTIVSPRKRARTGSTGPTTRPW